MPSTGYTQMVCLAHRLSSYADVRIRRLPVSPTAAKMVLFWDDGSHAHLLSLQLPDEMRNIRLTLAYDGTEYCGWQTQPQAPTVQASVEGAIQEVTRGAAALIAAGRTDSGVHAVGQVAHFHTESGIPIDRIKPALQSCLPRDIVVLEATLAPDSFHARYSALRKRYRYVIDNSATPLPFLNRYACYIRGPLDAEAMHEAAQALVGTHDFRCFESHWPNRASSVRTIFELTVQRQPGWPAWFQPHALGPTQSAAGDIICLDVVADGFLYNMVRSIAGTLLDVGRHKCSAVEVAGILAAQSRADAGVTAPARGLYLMQVEYGADGSARTSATEEESPAD